MEKYDGFRFEISLRHPTYSPEQIGKALSLTPRLASAAGQRVGNLVRKTTHFWAELGQGDITSEYDRELKAVVRFLKKNGAFLTKFIGGAGEVEIILNHTVFLKVGEGGKVFEIFLSPEFLLRLATLGIGLRVQGWETL